MESCGVSPIQDGGGVWVNAKPARISGFFFADGQINICDAPGSAFKLQGQGTAPPGAGLIEQKPMAGIGNARHARCPCRRAPD